MSLGTVPTLTYNYLTVSLGTVPTLTYNYLTVSLGTVPTLTYNYLTVSLGTVPTLTYNYLTVSLGTVPTLTYNYLTVSLGTVPLTFSVSFLRDRLQIQTKMVSGWSLEVVGAMEGVKFILLCVLHMNNAHIVHSKTWVHNNHDWPTSIFSL